MSKPHIEVAAGLVFRQGRLLITRRLPQSHLGGLWEFPGGKRHAGETFAQCLARELKEELGIEVRVGEVFESIVHEYPAKIVRLEFLVCRWLCHEPRPLGCAALAWIGPEQLDAYAFPPADARLLDGLRAAHWLWAGDAPAS